jgi:hypothetical protein
LAWYSESKLIGPAAPWYTQDIVTKITLQPRAAMHHDRARGTRVEVVSGTGRCPGVATGFLVQEDLFQDAMEVCLAEGLVQDGDALHDGISE